MVAHHVLIASNVHTTSVIDTSFFFNDTATTEIYTISPRRQRLMCMRDRKDWVFYDTLNSNMPHHNINNLKTDNSGKLWMSFHGGGGFYQPGLTSFDNQIWTSHDTLNSGIMSNNIWDIEIDDENNIWVGCEGGISKFDGSICENYPVNFI